MKRRPLLVALPILAAIACAAFLVIRGRSDWRPLPGGGQVCIYRVTYEKSAHVSFGGSPLRRIDGFVPRSLWSTWKRVAGPRPSDWWLPPRDPLFAVWTVQDLPKANSFRLERMLLILPDGQELTGQPGGFTLGNRYRVQPFLFDPALRTLPRFHLRLFAKDHPEPIDFDIPNPIRDAPSADPAK